MPEKQKLRKPLTKPVHVLDFAKCAEYIGTKHNLREVVVLDKFYRYLIKPITESGQLIDLSRISDTDDFCPELIDIYGYFIDTFGEKALYVYNP